MHERITPTFNRQLLGFKGAQNQHHMLIVWDCKSVPDLPAVIECTPAAIVRVLTVRRVMP